MAAWWLRGSADNKLHPGPYIAAHLDAVTDGSTGGRRRADLLWLYGPPVGLAAVSLLGRWNLSPAAASLVGIPIGLIAAYLVGFIFQMFDRASAWADTKPTPGRWTSEHGVLLQQLNAHGAYAALVSIAAAIATLMAGIHHDTNWVEHLLVAAAYGLALHMVLVLLLIVRRAYLYSSRRIGRATTGADLDEPADL